MTENYEHIAALIIKDLKGSISGSERRDLNDWLSASEEHRQFRESYRDLEQLLGMLHAVDGLDKEGDWVRLTEKIPELRSTPLVQKPDGRIDRIRPKERPNLLHRITPPLYVYFLGKPGALRRTAWALILILFSFWAVWHLLVSRRSDEQRTASNHERQPMAGSGHSVKEQQGKTYMDFGNGRLVDLDTVRVGRLIGERNSNPWFRTETGVAWIRSTGNGTGVADNTTAASDDGTGTPGYIRFYTTRGRNGRLTLPDGSEIWLNAASCLRIPTSFDSGSREVELRGEAYFEIAHHNTDLPLADIPFTVRALSSPAQVAAAATAALKEAPGMNASGSAAGNMTVQAYGTAFNIRAYPGEDMISATLVEGSVYIGWEGRALPVRLKAGRQFRLYQNGRHEDAPGDIGMILSWKDNKFNFRGAGLPEILGELTRWYGKDIVNEDSITKPFSFMAPRSDSLPAVLDILRGTHGLNWRRDGDKFIITR